MTGSALIVILVLAKFNFNISDLLGTAGDNYADSANAAAAAAGNAAQQTAGRSRY